MPRTTEEVFQRGRVWNNVSNAGGEKAHAHSVSHRALQRSVLFGLAADVVKGKQQMVVVCQIGRNLHLYLLVKLRRPWREELKSKFMERSDRSIVFAIEMSSSYLLW